LTIFDAAIYEEQKNGSAFDWEDPKLGIVGDCLFLHPTYPPENSLYTYTNYKGQSTSNFIQEVFQKGRPLRMGYVTEISPPLMETVSANENNKDSILLEDDITHKRVVGKLPDLEKRLLQRISDHYHLKNPIRAVQILYESSDAVFEALEKGEIDTTSLTFSLGSVYKNKPRRWQFLYSCTGVSYRLAFFVNKLYQDKVKNFDDYISFLTSVTEPGYILVGTNRIRGIALELLYDALFANNKFDNFIFEVMPDEDRAFDLLETGYNNKKVYGYLPRYLGEVPSKFKNSAYIIPTKQSIPVGMFFRRDKKEPPSDVPEDNYSETDISVLVLISIFSVICIIVAIAVAFSQRPTSMHLPQYEAETTSEVQIDEPLIKRRRPKTVKEAE